MGDTLRRTTTLTLAALYLLLGVGGATVEEWAGFAGQAILPVAAMAGDGVADPATNSSPNSPEAPRRSGTSYFHVHGPDFHGHWHHAPVCAAAGDELGDDDEEIAATPAASSSAPSPRRAPRLTAPTFVHADHACPAISLCRLLQQSHPTRAGLWDWRPGSAPWRPTPIASSIGLTMHVGGCRGPPSAPSASCS
ncbi:MAG: hypothetical protein KF847_06990 [Pirellulales bacterium]|nr:hypothetical protein [Pirellulales bacterium]